MMHLRTAITLKNSKVLPNIHFPAILCVVGQPPINQTLCVPVPHMLYSLSLSMTTEYARIVQIHQEEEARRARHNLRRRAIKKRDLLQTFQRRRLQNFLEEDEVVGCTRSPPPTPPLASRRGPQHNKRSQIPKDGAYKRKGFVWCDLGRTPKARLALVVPPIAVKREREFIEQLLRKVEAEGVQTRQRAREPHERVAAQRERLRNKVALNKAHQAQSMAALLRMPGPEKCSMENIAKARETIELPDSETRDLKTDPEQKDIRRVVLSKRHEQLACPRTPPDGVWSFVVSGSTDLVGLLHANPVLKGFLEWHLEDLRDDMLASQAAILKQTDNRRTPCLRYNRPSCPRRPHNRGL